MAQRISLALALLAHPSLIILDEPTSGVDSAIANLFLLKLKEFVKGDSSSVLLVTQDLSFAKMVSDKIALLSNGSLSEFLSPEEFFRIQNNLSIDEIINSHLQINE
jgi:ABC-type multidrug transport system ATPase subunit